MGRGDPLEAAMFWVGALLAFMPVLVLVGVLLYVRRQRRRDGRENPTGADGANE
jgi:hypothetical protein